MVAMRHRYTSRPSFTGPCKLAADVYRAGYTSRPSLQGACKLGAGVYRHAAPPALERPELTPPLQTRGRSVPTPIASVLVWPEFTDPLQTRRGCVPGASAAPARTGVELAESCELGPGAYPRRRRPRTHPDRPCGIVRTRGRRVPPARMARGARSSLSLDRRRHARRKDLVQSRLVQHGHPKLLRLRQLRTRRLARDDVARALRY